MIYIWRLHHHTSLIGKWVSCTDIFNRLKFCSPDTRFTEPPAAGNRNSTQLLDQQPIGTELEMIETEDDDDNDTADAPAR